MSESRTMWLNFFRSAGIPGGFDTKYAVIFDEHRIKQDMLSDITKDCLRDMGITAMGDIIAILKHARKVHEESKQEDLEVPKPTSTVQKVPSATSAFVGRLMKASASSTTSKLNSPTTTPVKTVSQKTTPVSKVKVSSESAGSESAPKKSITISPSVVAKASSSKPTMSISQRIASLTSSSQSKPGAVKKVSTSGGGDDDDEDDEEDTSRTSRPTISFKDDAKFLSMKKKIIILKSESNDSSDSSALKEEVPLQKKIRVLPEHEGKYKIKMPEGTTPKTQKLLQSRLGPGPSAQDQQSKDKKSIFDRLGDSRVSSTCDSKKLISLSSSSSSSKLSPLKRSGSIPSDEEPEREKDDGGKSGSSVFSRLGNKSSSNTASASASSSSTTQSISSSSSSSSTKLQIDKSVGSLKFEVRQSLSGSSSASEQQRSSPVIRRDDLRQKTLSVVRPRSTISFNSRTPPPREERSGSATTSTSFKSGTSGGMRSDAIRSRESANVKARLGHNTHAHPRSRSRSRSRSPPMMKKGRAFMMSGSAGAASASSFSSQRSRSRSRSPIYSRDDIRNTLSRRPSSVVTTAAPPPRRMMLNSKVTTARDHHHHHHHRGGGGGGGSMLPMHERRRDRDNSRQEPEGRHHPYHHNRSDRDRDRRKERRMEEDDRDTFNLPPPSKVSSRNVSHDSSFVLADDIEDPLAGCFSDSD